MKKILKTAVSVLLLAALFCMTGCAQKEQKTSDEFSPKLDTTAQVVLNAAGFFGNFEAFDQVTNDFNRYYPNIEFNYEQISVENYESYMEANPGVDIIMTSEDVFDKYGAKVEDSCADLTKENINVTAIDTNMLNMGYHNGKLLSVPMGQNLYGLVVNVSLLEKEGLSVPDTYEDFIHVLTVLKDKGYTPIQGPNSKVCAELTQGMAYDMIMNDKNLYNDLLAGKESAADRLQSVYEKVNVLLEKGFIDTAVNAEYPNDNYDKAILKFFEGDVPFWVCNTEKVSGMKKRESKSEAYQANPFTYTYINAPLGENGVYAYSEPWFGFAVNKNGNDYAYAVEFLRFLATKDEINKIADIKGVPSVAVEKSDVAVYRDILNPQKTELSYVNDGTISQAMIRNWYTCMNKFAAGEFDSPKAAAEYYVGLCGGN